MVKIATQNLQPGMVTRQDIKDKNGRLILPENTSIEAKHLRMLKMWGIYEADIQQAEGDEAPPQTRASSVSTEQLKAAGRIISPRYAQTNTEHPCIKAIFKQHALTLAERIASGQEVQAEQKAPAQEPLEKDIKDLPAVKLSSILGKDIELFTLPDIFYRLKEIINNPRSSAQDIAQVVANDTALTARTLKLVNSPFYGFPQKIETISKAVTVIGTKQLSTLALGLSVLKLFKDVPSTYLDMDKFWRHCLAVGLCAKLISEHIDYPESEKMFVGGILHDLGRLVLLKKVPEHTAAAIKYTWNNDVFLTQAEKKCIGMTHSIVGAELCNYWKLSPFLVDAVKYHHAPRQGRHSYECSIVHLAEIMVNALEIGSSAEKMVLQLNPQAWDSLNISYNAIPPILKQLNNEIDSILELLK
ncbi:MAG: HDOD domain-containing protein [Desulfohalobiaceae bacterium]